MIKGQYNHYDNDSMDGKNIMLLMSKIIMICYYDSKLFVDSTVVITIVSTGSDSLIIIG